LHVIDILRHPCIMGVVKVRDNHLQREGKIMGTMDLLNLAKASGLTAAQKSELKKKLGAKKRELAGQIKSIDQGLKALAKGTAKKRKKR
jgi:hypothetical protein